MHNDSTQNSLLEHALQYAGRGWRVFPLRARGKTPLTKGGFKAATVDPRQIEAWWKKWPEANIGIATGAASGLFVLDIDGAHGEAHLVELQELYGCLPETLTVKTARGRHIYFALGPGQPPPCSSGNGVDVRCSGGYVVAPPSVHESGHVYTWVAP
jgi:hypothetical protein